MAGRLIVVQEENTGRNASAIEHATHQGNNRLQLVGFDQLFTDLPVSYEPEGYTPPEVNV